MLSSSCCERLSLISLTKENPVEKGPGAVEVEGWDKRLLAIPRLGEETSRGGNARWERLRGGRESTHSWKFRDARLVVGSAQEIRVGCWHKEVACRKKKKPWRFPSLHKADWRECLTCIARTWFWGVPSVEWRRSFLAAIRGRLRPEAVLLCAQYCSSVFRNLSILEVLLQPGGDDALHRVCDPTDEARLWL